MFVVHWTWWAPRLSGMYQSVKDQIKYERKAGMRSEFGDCHNPERDMSKKKDG